MAAPSARTSECSTMYSTTRRADAISRSGSYNLPEPAWLPMTVSRAVNIADLRLLAKRRLPRAVFDYIDGGADSEITLRENCRVFEDVTFRPRNAVATPDCDLRVKVLGATFDLPFLLAPVGSSRLFYPRGEEVAARAAGLAGTGYILSTLSGCRLEDVRSSKIGPAWYQMYIVGGRLVEVGGYGRARLGGSTV